MAFTYDPSTSRGRVRLLLADTNSSSYTFEDEEIDAFLSLSDDNPLMAAALALRSAAADHKKVAGLVRLFREADIDMREAISRLIELADSYERRAMAQAGATVTQLQQKIDEYGRDLTDFDVATAETDLEDYEQEWWDSL